jgi:hypothetical protein
MGTLELTDISRLTRPRRTDDGLRIPARLLEMRPEAAPLDRDEVLLFLGPFEGWGVWGAIEAHAAPPLTSANMPASPLIRRSAIAA